MYSRGHVLQSAAEFDNAVYMGLIVSVTQNNEHLCSGNIVSHNLFDVVMNYHHYRKCDCTFTVATNSIAHSIV